MKKATARPIKYRVPKKAGQYSANLLQLAIMPVCLFVFATRGGGEGSGSTPDTTPPQVCFTSPNSNATDVLVTASITATFSEAIDPASIDSSSFTLEGPSGFVPGTVSCSDFTATFTPTDNLVFSTSYAAAITTAVKDLAGNPLPSDTSWIFTTVSAPAATLLSALFDNGTGGFLYQDDAFLGTNQPGHASGTYEPTGGHSGGGLHVTLGGIDNNNITGMSGGWTYMLNLSSSVSGVMITFRYRLQQSANYEYDEYSRMLVSVDGMLHGRGSKDYVDHVGGDGDDGIVKETGWVQHRVYLGTLTSGPHALILGGYTNHKNASDESTDIWIDDVVITSGNPVPTPSVAQTIVGRLDINRFKSDIQTLSNYDDCRDNEESGLYGSQSYANDRRSMQGIENPPGSGQFPEPNWLGIVQHDMILYDHGVGTAGPDQSPYADLDVEWRAGTIYATQSMNLAQDWRLRNGNFSTQYPANSADHSTNTDDTPFQNYTASISVRENRRSLGNEWINPFYHQNTDVYASYLESDFNLGFNAVQATVGLIAELAGANAASPNNPPVVNSQSVRRSRILQQPLR